MAAIEAGAASNIITKTNAHLDFQGPQLMQDL
jgi:hypothetical protein